MQARDPISHFLDQASMVAEITAVCYLVGAELPIGADVDVKLPLNLQGTSANWQAVHASPVLAGPPAIELVSNYFGAHLLLHFSRQCRTHCDMANDVVSHLLSGRSPRDLVQSLPPRRFTQSGPETQRQRHCVPTHTNRPKTKQPRLTGALFHAHFPGGCSCFGAFAVLLGPVCPSTKLHSAVTAADCFSTLASAQSRGDASKDRANESQLLANSDLPEGVGPPNRRR